MPILLHLGASIMSDGRAHPVGPAAIMRGGVAVALFLTTACGPSGSAPDLVIQNVSVVDVATGDVSDGQAVAVRGNRIVYVGGAAGAGARDSTEVIDGAGAYVIPGLWDMHAHVLNPGWSTLGIKSLVANGITGFREMWGNLAVAQEAREGGNAGEYPVPRFIMAGNLVDGPIPVWPTSTTADTPERGRAVVDSLTDGGAGFIKVYSGLSPDVYRAIAERAHERDIPFAGHVPQRVTSREASQLGQRSMEHLLGVIPGCSTADDAIREYAEDLAERERRRRAGETVSLTESSARFTRRILDSQDDARCREQFDVFVANETWQVPTLVTLRGVRHVGDSAFEHDPRLEYMPASMRAFWSETTSVYIPFRSEDQLRSMRRERELVGMMHLARVPLLAGSDTPNPYAFFGSGLHDELSLFVESGVPPLDALRAATLSAARFLGATDSLGAVEAGKLADLVLLDGNPLEDIENVRRIRGVMLDGVYYARQVLDTMLDDIKRAASTM